MKMLFVMSSFGVGGAERVMAALANAFSIRGDLVQLLVYADSFGQSAFPLLPGVQVSSFPMVPAPCTRLGRIGYTITSNIRYVSVIRSKIDEFVPDVVLSFIDFTNIRTLIAAAGTNIPVVISERTDPNARHIGMGGEVARRVMYRSADILVTQSMEAMTYFSPRIQSRAVIIPNPIVLPPLYRESFNRRLARRPGVRLVAVGSLRHVKGIDLLISAFALAARALPNWRLTIFGDGPLRSQLEDQITQLGMRDSIKLPGRTDDVFAALEEADIFVLPSRAEGFPMALLEAMATGLPCIAFDCPSGPRQLIRHNINGLLVRAENVQALAAAMVSLMVDEHRRHTLGRAAAGVADTFGIERILNMWDAAFKSAIFRAGAAG